MPSRAKHPLPAQGGTFAALRVTTLLFTAIPRLAFLAECHDPFAKVRRLTGDFLLIGLVVECRLQVDAQGPVEVSFHEPDRARRTARQPLGQLPRPRHELVCRINMVHEPDALGLDRRDRVASKAKLQRTPDPHEAGKEERRPESNASPTRANAVLSVAPSAAVRMSHASARPQPAPAATPLIAAMIGFSIVRIRMIIGL